MKTIKIISTRMLTVFLLSQLLTSCSSSLNIAKRHYNPGYYVSLKSNTKKTIEKKQIPKVPVDVSEKLADKEKTDKQITVSDSSEFPLTASLNKTRSMVHINHNKSKENNLLIISKTIQSISPVSIVSKIKNIKQEQQEQQHRHKTILLLIITLLIILLIVELFIGLAAG